MNKLIKMLGPRRRIVPPDHKEDRLFNSWSKHVSGRKSKISQLSICEFIKDDENTLDFNYNMVRSIRSDKNLVLDCLIPYDLLEV